MDCQDERQRGEAWENGRCERITHAWNERDAVVVVVVMVMVKKSVCLSCLSSRSPASSTAKHQRTSNANQPKLKLTFIQLLA